MKPVNFKGANTIYAKDQPEYTTLYANIDDNSGVVTSCWELTLEERLEILNTGRVFVSVMTFNKELQPLRLTVKNPVEE